MNSSKLLKSCNDFNFKCEFAKLLTVVHNFSLKSSPFPEGWETVKMLFNNISESTI